MRVSQHRINTLEEDADEEGRKRALRSERADIRVELADTVPDRLAQCRFLLERALQALEDAHVRFLLLLLRLRLRHRLFVHGGGDCGDVGGRQTDRTETGCAIQRRRRPEGEIEKGKRDR